MRIKKISLGRSNEHVIRQKAFYPQLLLDKFNKMNAHIGGLTAQLTSKDEKIPDLEERVEKLEESADRTEQYSRRSNLLFSGFEESGKGENSDGKIITLVNDALKLTPYKQAHDIARSQRLGVPHPIIVRFSSDKALDSVDRTLSGLKMYNSQHREAPVFVNDDLTTRRAKLAFDCRKLKKKGKSRTPGVITLKS